MPSTSRKQRRFFGWVEHNPDQAKAEGKYPKGMSHQAMHDFASTPEKGLPEHVEHKEDGDPSVSAGSGRRYYGKEAARRPLADKIPMPTRRRFYGKP
jgi:hypothetical protein